MAMTLTCVFAVLCVIAFSSSTLAQNTSSIDGISGNVTAVFLDPSTCFAICVYPNSGLYSFLNRLIYYCILVFSLFSRAHLWLVAGALAAALTYAGSAAVHACLLVWRGPNPYVENDSLCLYAILNCACLITVPLLNWSGTLRRLGAKAANIKDPKGTHTQSNVSTRTIVIYWAFLVLVGFICIWYQIIYNSDTSYQQPDMSKVMCGPGTNAGLIRATDGTTLLRVIDTQFVQANNCSDPCNQVSVPSIFRQQNDLVLLGHQKANLWDAQGGSTKYEKMEKQLGWAYKLFNLDYWTLPFVVVQGFVATLFGRRDPREIRDLIYIKLFMQRPLSHKPYLHRSQDFLVRFLAALNYVLAVAVILLCPPLFVASIVSSEIQFWYLTPDAEAPYAVGQWEPWVVAVQVLLAALIARYHEKVIGFIASTVSGIFHRLHKKGGQTDDEHSRTSITGAGAGNPLEGKPDIRANARPGVSPLQPGSEEDASLWHRLRDKIYHAYKMCAHPLNQSDQGLFDEVRNFVHWCGDPQAVSRLVVRHPVRPRDKEDNEGASTRGDGDGEFKHTANKGNMNAGSNEKSNSGFFHTASTDEGRPPAQKWGDNLGV